MLRVPTGERYEPGERELRATLRHLWQPFIHNRTTTPLQKRLVLLGINHVVQVVADPRAAFRGGAREKREETKRNRRGEQDASALDTRGVGASVATRRTHHRRACRMDRRAAYQCGGSRKRKRAMSTRFVSSAGAWQRVTRQSNPQKLS